MHSSGAAFWFARKYLMAFTSHNSQCFSTMLVVLERQFIMDFLK